MQKESPWNTPIYFHFLIIWHVGLHWPDLKDIYPRMSSLTKIGWVILNKWKMSSSIMVQLNYQQREEINDTAMSIFRRITYRYRLHDSVSITNFTRRRDYLLLVTGSSFFYCTKGKYSSHVSNPHALSPLSSVFHLSDFPHPFYSI